MPRLTKEDRIVRQIIKEYGAQVDLRANPDMFIEIVRNTPWTWPARMADCLPAESGPWVLHFRSRRGSTMFSRRSRNFSVKSPISPRR